MWTPCPQGWSNWHMNYTSSDNNVLIRSGEAPAVGWSRNMLYSGFIILPRSVFWSANFNGRSDNTDVIPLEHCLALLVCPTDSHGIRFDQFRILLDRRWQYGRSCRTRGQRAVLVPVRDHRGCDHTGNAAGLSPTQKLWPYRDRSSCNDTYSSHLDGQRNWRRSRVHAARSINYLYRDHCGAIFRNVLSTGNTPW